MQSLMIRLWNDDAGYLLSAESVFLFTIVVLGLLTGWVAIRNSVVNELVEVSNSINALDQGYGFSNISNCTGAHTTGVNATDGLSGITSSQTQAALAAYGTTPCTLVTP